MATELITSPLPGKILSVKVAAGDKVKEGDLLLTIEAMKMENEIVATVDGTVTEVTAKSDSTVQIGDSLVSIEEG
jgi:pyruvate carboxylase subunit B